MVLRNRGVEVNKSVSLFYIHVDINQNLYDKSNFYISLIYVVIMGYRQMKQTLSDVMLSHIYCFTLCLNEIWKNYCIKFS